METRRVRIAENDVKHSSDIEIIGRFNNITGRDKKGNRRWETTIVAVGNSLDNKSEAWNNYVGKVSFHGEFGRVSVQRHTASDSTPDGSSVFEVVLFDNKLHAEGVCERLEQSARAKLEVIER